MKKRKWVRLLFFITRLKSCLKISDCKQLQKSLSDPVVVTAAVVVAALVVLAVVLFAVVTNSEIVKKRHIF